MMDITYTIKEVSSSLIKRVYYEPLTEVLMVTFKNNAEYTYYKVSNTVVKDLLDSESVGKYFIQNIKNNYKFTKLEE